MPAETLTSRERVICTLNRQPVDRMPIDLGSHMSTGISAFAYWNLREHLGLPTGDIWMPDVVQTLAYVDEDIRARFHLDCILLEPRWPHPARWNPRGKYQFSVPEEMNPRLNSARGMDRHQRQPAYAHAFRGLFLRRGLAFGVGRERRRRSPAALRA